jgi:hypothetical protein
VWVCNLAFQLSEEIGLSMFKNRLLRRVLYFPAYKTHRPITRTVIFLLGILEKNNDECILILVIYWKKTGLLHVLLQKSKTFTSSDARSHDLESDFTI